ncbi:hypothetical protein J3E71DRAFT_342931 [Bipolaris maydis]|nr:hypothetical protein J3E73DRAFT_371911 [Bipolaris maydis]KAJ6280825.1 hypothetical protein J3E71DRAFT_342931 [Bipolaris maydis]
MSNDVHDVRVALQTITQAPIASLLINTRELCEANFVIAKAIHSLHSSFCEDVGKFETQLDDAADRAIAQAQVDPILEVSTRQGGDQETMRQYEARRGRPEHAVMRLVQYWIQKKMAGPSVLKDEIRKQQSIVNKALEKIKEQIGITNKAKKEVAIYKGHALATTHSLLVSLSRNNFEVATGIVYHIFKRLKDVDSKEKATRAINNINGYLERQFKTIEDYTTL